MIRAYKYPLRPNRTQEKVLLSWLESCRVLYNAALEQRREAYRRARKTIGYMDQTKDLTELRAADPELEAVPVEAARSTLRSLQRGFDGFFRRVKLGETPGYPRFRGRERFDSFGIGRASVEGKKVRIPKLGLVKFHKYRELGGSILDARIVWRADRWWIVFFCDMGEAPAKRPVAAPVGVDVGLASFATLSTGEKIGNPRFLKAGEVILTRRQRALSRKRRGSAGRWKAKRFVARAHEHIHNQRLDFARKLTAELFSRYDCIFYEDLNIRGMASGRLAKSVQDAAWGLFARALADKAECAGRWAIPVDPSGTSLRCSGCSESVAKTLAERIHRCPRCGLVLDRDENAARNILALGRSAVEVGGRSPSN